MKSVLKAMAIMVLTAVFAVGCSKPDYPYNGEGSGVYNGHEYVDLGLPSGTLWATCNVGAKAPRDYGDYFAWGETSAKTNYYLGTYKYNYCNDDGCGFTKYCNDPLSKWSYMIGAILFQKMLKFLEESIVDLPGT